ncbi:hypothetical protein AB0F36_08000 [Streptomyces sp. NPDC029080]|uniref:hypothetical protein n=1 Tax=Streptomyces sp. NPDC029080 TaxID=3155017 RepID=UPI0033E6D24E
MRLTDALWFVSQCGQPSGLLLRMGPTEDHAYVFPPRPVRMDVGDLVNGHVPFFPWSRSDAVLRLQWDHERTYHPESMYLD